VNSWNESLPWSEPLARKKVRVPVVALGGAKGLGVQVERMARQVAEDVTAETLADCGHFVPEECPDAVVRHIRSLAAKLS